MLGGMVDTVMMRIVDIISTIPLTLYVILIMVLLGCGHPEYYHRNRYDLLGRYGARCTRSGTEPEKSGICHGGKDDRLFDEDDPCLSI